jgi:hypothetical protein
MTIVHFFDELVLCINKNRLTGSVRRVVKIDLLKGHLTTKEVEEASEGNRY